MAFTFSSVTTSSRADRSRPTRRANGLPGPPLFPLAKRPEASLPSPAGTAAAAAPQGPFAAGAGPGAGTASPGLVPDCLIASCTVPLALAAPFAPFADGAGLGEETVVGGLGIEPDCLA